MKRFSVIALALLLVVVFSLPVSVSAVEEPGIKPGSFFYGLVTTFEKINLFFTFSPEKKAEKALKYAEKRLVEVGAVADEENSDAVKIAVAGYEENIALAAEASKKVKDEARAENLLTLIADNTSRHQEVLSVVLLKVPEEAREAITRAIETSRKGQEEATQKIAELKGEVEKLKQEVAELKAKDETQTKAVEELSKQKPESMSVPAPQAPTKTEGARTTNIATLPNGAVVEMDVNGKILRYIKEAPTNTTTQTPVIPAQPKIYDTTPLPTTQTSIPTPTPIPPQVVRRVETKLVPVLYSEPTNLQRLIIFDLEATGYIDDQKIRPEDFPISFSGLTTLEGIDILIRATPLIIERFEINGITPQKDQYEENKYYIQLPKGTSLGRARLIFSHSFTATTTLIFTVNNIIFPSCPPYLEGGCDYQKFPVGNIVTVVPSL